MKLSLPEMPSAQLLGALKAYSLLPAIIFLPTRRRCDQAASEAALARREHNTDRREARREMMIDFVAEHPEVRGHRHWETIIKGGVAAHHAGHIPAWKLAIEQLMSAGLLDAIFATATVAAGVDFPARTVVITNVDSRTAGGWRQLSASELQQMTGRAGRRGRDNVGFVVAAPGLHQDPERIAQLLTAPSDPLQSQFRATYSTLLNLLDAYGNFAQVRDIIEKSFGLRDALRRVGRLERDSADAEQRMRQKLDDAGCNLPTSFARGLERLASARQRLLETLPQTRAEMNLRWLHEVVTPGRVVGIGRNSRRLMIVMRRRGGTVIGMREDGRGVNLELERIGRVYAPTYQLDEKSIEAAFTEVRANSSELVLREPKLSDARAGEDDAVTVINDLMDKIAQADIDVKDRKNCFEALWSVIGDAEIVERSERRIRSIRSELWEPFERRARVLDAFGYLDFNLERVTERGRWLADLRVDRPLLVGEAVDKGLFVSLDAPHVAGLMAALAADEERDYGALELDDAMVSALARFEEVAYNVSTEEWKQGLEPTAEINFSAAATAVRWASGCEWGELVQETRAEEGDLVRMLSRTGEALLQVAGLRRARIEAARVAARAAEAVLREPVR